MQTLPLIFSDETIGAGETVVSVPLLYPSSAVAYHKLCPSKSTPQVKSPGIRVMTGQKLPNIS